MIIMATPKGEFWVLNTKERAKKAAAAGLPPSAAAALAAEARRRDFGSLKTFAPPTHLSASAIS